MIIFDYTDYKDFVRDRIKQMPKRGHGQYRKMAALLGVHSVVISQIFKGTRDLSVEQACALGEFFGFTELECEYFVALVELERAGTHPLRKMIKKRLELTRAKSQDLKHRLTQSSELSEDAKATFYSKWYYSGIRLLSSVPGYQTPDAIAEHLGLSVATVSRVLAFLTQVGLCRESAGKYQMGPSSTHLEASSPLVSRHHVNWRVKAFEKMESPSAEELFLTLPCSLSEKAMVEIRKELVKAIEKITKTIDEAPCERLACLNLDFFRF